MKQLASSPYSTYLLYCTTLPACLADIAMWLNGGAAAYYKQSRNLMRKMSAWPLSGINGVVAWRQ